MRRVSFIAVELLTRSGYVFRINVFKAEFKRHRSIGGIIDMNHGLM